MNTFPSRTKEEGIPRNPREHMGQDALRKAWRRGWDQQLRGRKERGNTETNEEKLQIRGENRARESQKKKE